MLVKGTWSFRRHFSIFCVKTLVSMQNCSCLTSAKSATSLRAAYFKQEPQCLISSIMLSWCSHCHTTGFTKNCKEPYINTYINGNALSLSSQQEWTYYAKFSFIWCLNINVCRQVCVHNHPNGKNPLTPLNLSPINHKHCSEQVICRF